jgi:hypothetical protein
MNDAMEVLGTLIDESAKRDAIHIAVAPVIAGNTLKPGQNIGFLPGSSEKVSGTAEHIGIVDPYLKAAVKPGERFYMFLYPRTITSLRHEWTHPAFADVVTRDASKEASERWLRAFVDSANCPEYEAVIAAAVEDQHGDGDDYYGSRNDGQYLHFGGRDAHGEIPPEFWDHVEVVTGRKITKRPTYFSCSC